MQRATRTSLFFKCEGLADTDTFSKSDPYLVLYRVADGRETRVARTETVMNNLNPAFQTPIEVDYIFETKQNFVAKVYDYDGHQSDDKNDFLGEVRFTLAHVMCSRGHEKEFIIGAPFKGKLTITAVEYATTNEDTISLTFYGRKLKKMDTFSLSDPYFKLWRLLPNQQRLLVYQSEVIDDTLDPNWKPLPTLKVSQLMGKNSSEKTVELECFDEDVFGFKGMGCVKLSVDDLLRASQDQTNVSFELRKAHKPENFYGFIHVGKCDIVRSVTFEDLLSSGWQINMATAIDFTASNGDPRKANSLHFMNPAAPNEYAQAIMSVGEIVLDYDADKMIAAFGFGAQLPDGQVSHNFHLTLEPSPYVAGIPGLMAAYQRSIMSLKLSGPTNFAPIIFSVASGARQAASDRIYTILVILTDGEISDIDDTIDALVAADDAALSIIIVGVGSQCDFSAMVQLDGDDGPLVSRGRASRRDLVQFVPMRDFLRRSSAELAAEVLKEVPAQIQRWAAITGLTKTSLFGKQ